MGCGCISALSSGPGSGESSVILAAGEPAQIDYEIHRAHVVEKDLLPDDLAGARFGRCGAGRADLLGG
jgi:hypothetical protein